MFCISSSQTILLPSFFSQNILCTFPAILTRTGLIPRIMQGQEEIKKKERRLSSRAPQVLQQIILSQHSTLHLPSPVACLGAGNECLSQPGLQKLGVEQRQFLRLHCTLTRALSVPTSSLRNSSAHSSSCRPSLAWCCAP